MPNQMPGSLTYNILKERKEKMNAENLDFLDTPAAEYITFYAAGLQFRDGWRKNLANLKEGEELFLVLEPTNKFDKNAVQLCTGEGVFIGYVPAKPKESAKNLWVKETLLEGKRLKATVLELYAEADPWRALLVEIAPII